MSSSRFQALSGIFTFALALTGASLSVDVQAQELPRSPASDTPRPGVVRPPLPPNESEGLPVALVFYNLFGRSGETDGDRSARTRIEKAFGIRSGDVFNEPLVMVGLQRIGGLSFVRSVHYDLYASDRPGHVVLAVTAELGPLDSEITMKSGVVTGDRGDFPILYEDDRMQWRLLLDGGFGYFTDVNPWFGNAPAFTGASPVALDAAAGETASWYEQSVEYGLAGVTRIGDLPALAYGAGTFLTSYSTGQDLFRSDARELTRLEDLYGGIVFGSPDADWSANLSAGRQNWQLYDGFLFSRFAAGANAGPHPGLYLNPRTAYERTYLGEFKWKEFKVEGFYLDPAEIDTLDSNSTYAGVNLSYTSKDGPEASILFYESPESKTTFAAGAQGTVPREGLQTLDGRLGSSSLFGIGGLELFGEYAAQSHETVDWDANAWYLRSGYTFAELPWKPNLSYRYASFSGDDPATSTYERFDAPLSSGLDTWVQGITAKKVVTNSNLDSHRIRLNMVPTEKLSLTFDYFWLFANEGPGASPYGTELDLGVRWAISKNLFFLGVAGVTFPDDRLRAQAGGDLDDWSTFQTSLFWNF